MFYIVIGSIAAILVAVSILLAFVWRVVVPTNQVHIVQSSKKTVSYGRGREAGNTYYSFPAFLPIIGVTVSQFPESVFDINLKDYEAYDQGRLPFVVDVRAFFRISDSQVAAQRVANFQELQGQLIGVLQGAIRRILATNHLENILEARGTLGQQFTDEVDANLKEWGVSTVKIIEIMDIRDGVNSKVIHNIMAKEQSRIEMESRTVVASNFREAEMKEIEAKREVDLSKTQAAQTVATRQAEAEKEVGIAKEQSTQEVLTQAKTTTERQQEVNRVNQVRQAEIERDVAAVKAEQDKTVQVVNAQATKETQVIAADAEKESKTRIAEGDLAATLKEADGIQAIGTAKADAESKILLAPVNAQLTLAKEIGTNDSYQTYLISIRQVEAGEAVGKEMAAALKAADLKVIANSGTISNGVASLGDIISPAGGTSIAGMLEALSQTSAGKAVLDKLTVPASTDTKTKK